MSIELRPFGVACNLACHYCYQNPQRDAGNQRMSYDLEKMKSEASRIGGPFVLFGGEPLLMRFEDLENLFAWGLEKHGGNSIQTNGVLIEDRHIDLFRRYKVAVGISIDGPGELNDVRWHRELEKTRQSTALVEAVIAKLCREYRPPGLIITLHKGNATGDKLPRMAEWLKGLDELGIKGVRLHLLEVDHESVRESLALSSKENIQAMLAFAQLQESLKSIRFDLFQEMESLLAADDNKAGCTWRACDPYTTSAVQGIEGNGQSSNCGRTNKDGIGFIKADTAGYERYLALYRTPQSENGCAGCRFFLMCKGQCPGTSIHGDWRNRTEHCEEWKELFRVIERRMIVAGKTPFTIQPVRLEMERRQILAWEQGSNPSVSRGLSMLYKERQAVGTDNGNSTGGPTKLGVRTSWVGNAARDLWAARIERIQTALEDMAAHAPKSPDLCSVRLVRASSFHRLIGVAASHGLAAATLPAGSLSGAIRTCSASGATGLFLSGTPSAVGKARAALARGDAAAFRARLEIPRCCGADAGWVPESGTVQLAESTTSHPLLADLGLSASPVMPCRLGCPEADQYLADWCERAGTAGFEAEAGWLREILAWPLAWSELHGVVEIKSPVFKLTLYTGTNAPYRQVLRLGKAGVQEGATGLRFPYLQPPRQLRDVVIQLAGRDQRGTQGLEQPSGAVAR